MAIINGTNDDDVLNGTASGDIINGFFGGDRLRDGDVLLPTGAGNNDTMDGGEDDDRLESFGGNDLMVGGGGNDILINYYRGWSEGGWRPIYSEMYGGAGNDLLLGAGWLYGDDGNDIIYIKGGSPDGTDFNRSFALGGAGDDKIIETFDEYVDYGAGQYTSVTAWGGLGNDIISIGYGANTVNGDEGDDEIRASGNIDGGAGNDKITFLLDDFASVTNVFSASGGDGDDYIIGYGGDGEIPDPFNPFLDSYIYGGNGNDRVENGDRVFGGAGNDTLEGGIVMGDEGDDIITAIYTTNGGAGNDTIYVATMFGDNYGDTGSDTFIAVAGFNTWSFYGLSPHITFSSLGSDFVDITGYNRYDAIYDGGTSLSGDVDRLVFGDGNDAVLTDDDGLGIELDTQRIINIEVIEAGGGNDVVNLTTAAYDVGSINVYAGTGDDVVWGNNANNMIFGEAGNDNIRGHGGIDTIHGNDGVDKLRGDNGNDFVYGDAGNDDVRGGNGDDFVYGGENDDRLEGDAGNDFLYGENGIDTLRGEEGNDFLDGGAGDDDARAGSGNDTVLGGAGVDTLYGESGLDILNGGAGVDKMYGGSDADIFVFDADAVTGRDTVRDFSLAQGDKLELHNLLTGYDPLTSLITNFVKITESLGNSYLNVDVNGTVGGTVWTQIARVDAAVGMTDEAALLTAGTLVVT
jgi:Ca2+-binding RTX toxin-like protein